METLILQITPGRYSPKGRTTKYFKNKNRNVFSIISKTEMFGESKTGSKIQDLLDGELDSIHITSGTCFHYMCSYKQT